MDDGYEDRHGKLTPEQMEAMTVSDWDARLDAYRLEVSGHPEQVYRSYRDADEALQKAKDDHGLKDSDLTLAGVSGGNDVAIFYRRSVDLTLDEEFEFFLDARM